jgi:hypothetical protein
MSERYYRKQPFYSSLWRAMNEKRLPIFKLWHQTIHLFLLFMQKLYEQGVCEKKCCVIEYKKDARPCVKRRLGEAYIKKPREKGANARTLIAKRVRLKIKNISKMCNNISFGVLLAFLAHFP